MLLKVKFIACIGFVVLRTIQINSTKELTFQSVLLTFLFVLANYSIRTKSIKFTPEIFCLNCVLLQMVMINKYCQSL